LFFHMSDWKSMHKAMAVLFRPIIHKKKQFYLIDEYGGSQRYSEVMKDMPLNVALGAMVFFYRLGEKLPLFTMDYLREVMKTEALTPQLKQALGENGDGINRYILSLRGMLEESMRLQERGFISVS